MSDFSDKARTCTDALRDLFPATPLQLNDHLSAKFDAQIWLKREDLSPVRSYKIRGAFNAMSKVRSEHPSQKLFVCASAGNHAQGVAFVCRHFGVKGVIFMPVTTPLQKIQKTEIFGGENVEIRLVGDYFDETLAASKEYCEKARGYFLAPFDDEDVILGQASVAVEAIDSLGRSPDMMVLPVGGGGLSAGIKQFLQTEAPNTQLKFVEPEGAKSLAAAVSSGAPVTLEQVDNFVDGASVARVGSLNFKALEKTHESDIISVPEDRICSTILEMLNVEGVVLEPAGALSIDALEDLRDEVRGKTVVCVASGGNFDFERLPEVKERAQRFLGLKKYFILRLPQRPGALKDFLLMLGPDDDIARFEYLKKSARNFGSVLIGIETPKASNFSLLFRKLEDAGFAYRDITADQTLSEFLV